MNMSTGSHAPSQEDDATVVFLSGDLMFASRVRAACEAQDFRFKLSGKLPSDPSVRWVIVDLSTRNGAVSGLMELVARECPEARVLAYGPHVQVARLKAAREAGIPTVLTRGQFDQMLGSLFAAD